MVVNEVLPGLRGRRTSGGQHCCIDHHNELIDGLTNQSSSITTEEWEQSIQFLTRVGQKCTPIRQEFILLSDTLGVSALVDSLNNPPIHGATESSVLGPFKTDDAPDGEWSFSKRRTDSLVGWSLWTQEQWSKLFHLYTFDPSLAGGPCYQAQGHAGILGYQGGTYRRMAGHEGFHRVNDKECCWLWPRRPPPPLIKHGRDVRVVGSPGQSHPDQLSHLWFHVVLDEQRESLRDL